MAVIKLSALQRGATVLELVFSIMLVAIFSAVLLQRLSYYQDIAEKAAVESMVSLIASGMRAQASALVAEGREREALQLGQQNPFLWLDRLPSTYQGDWPSDTAPICGGCWYYDAAKKEVIYLPKSENPGTARLRYSVIQRPGTVLSVALTPVNTYDWSK